MWSERNQTKKENIMYDSSSYIKCLEDANIPILTESRSVVT